MSTDWCLILLSDQNGKKQRTYRDSPYDDLSSSYFSSCRTNFTEPFRRNDDPYLMNHCHLICCYYPWEFLKNKNQSKSRRLYGKVPRILFVCL